MVADGAAETDLSYVGTALYSYTVDSNAGFLIRDTTGALSGPALVNAFDNLDGSRRGRIRYDTPDFNGFSAGVAWGQNILSSSDDADYYDIGLFYGQEFAAVEFSASLAYQVREDAGADRSDVLGAASVLLDNGISLTVAGGTRDNDAAGASDPSYYYAKIAYEDEWLAWGKTGIGVHYYDGVDFNVSGCTAKGWGIGAVQKVENLNTDTYLTYQEYEYEDAAATNQDLTTWVLGARWKFLPLWKQPLKTPWLSGAFFCAWRRSGCAGMSGFLRACAGLRKPHGTSDANGRLSVKRFTQSFERRRFIA